MDQRTQVIAVSDEERDAAAPSPRLADALERGLVLHMPAFPFPLSADELGVLDESNVDPERKNISFDPKTGGLAGFVGPQDARRTAEGLVRRYHETAQALIDRLFPHYRGRMRAAPASLRLHPIEGKALSWRKDDSRLHVDAFPSRPNRGERILRVFLNINPHGVARVWRVGEPFEDIARRFLPQLRPPLPGSAWLLNALHVTKSPRSRYDHLMLGLHDAMKADMGYQANSPQEEVAFPPGSAWICFSDQTSHAAMSGQFMLEQTFHLPLAAMADPAKSPLKVLERLVGRRLVEGEASR
ncbi:MAG: Kdo hydroxylase family protein [Burkholderiaceae bacterium]